MGMVRQIDDAALADRLIKTGPATTALEFCIAPEERIAAYRTIVGADLLVVFQRTAVWPLRTLLPRYIIHIPRKDVLPLIVGHIHRGRVGVRIDRIVRFVVGIELK